MKKLLKLFSIIGLSIVPSMTVVACGSEHYLDITIDDQNYQVNTNIAFRFMYYELASKQRPQVNRQYFSYWFWFVFPDDKTLTGRASGNVKDPNADHEKEYWTIELRKTSSKGLFVWKWYENNFNPL